MSSILIVDAYAEMRSLIHQLLQAHFYCSITECSSGTEAAILLQKNAFVLVISDFEMDCGSDLWLHHHMKASFPETPLVLISSVFDQIHLPLDQTLRGILRKDRVHELPRLLLKLKLDNLTAI